MILAVVVYWFMTVFTTGVIAEGIDAYGWVEHVLAFVLAALFWWFVLPYIFGRWVGEGLS